MGLSQDTVTQGLSPLCTLPLLSHFLALDPPRAIQGGGKRDSTRPCGASSSFTGPRARTPGDDEHWALWSKTMSPNLEKTHPLTVRSRSKLSRRALCGGGKPCLCNINTVASGGYVSTENSSINTRNQILIQFNTTQVCGSQHRWRRYRS